MITQMPRVQAKKECYLREKTYTTGRNHCQVVFLTKATVVIVLIPMLFSFFAVRLRDIYSEVWVSRAGIEYHTTRISSSHSIETVNKSIVQQVRGFHWQKISQSFTSSKTAFARLQPLLARSKHTAGQTSRLSRVDKIHAPSAASSEDYLHRSPKQLPLSSARAPCAPPAGVNTRPLKHACTYLPNTLARQSKARFYSV